MPDIWLDVDTALSEVPVNLLPLLDDTDFKTRETAVAYNAAGMDLVWNFVTTAGAFTQTAVTPTTGGNYDWTHQGDGMYTIEIPASGGASINNDTEGFGWFTGFATGVLPWRGPVIGFRAAGLNNKLIDDAYSATRGLAGTALPDAAADAGGGLPISDAGGLDLDARLDAAVSSRMATYTQPTGFLAATFPATAIASAANVAAVETDTQDIQSRLPAALTAGGNMKSDALAISGDTTAADNLELFFDGTGYNAANSTVGTVTTLTNAPADSTGTTTLLARLTAARAGYIDNLNVGGAVASQADINALNQSASRRVILATVVQFERPESGSSTYTVEARTYDPDGAAVNADSTPTLAATGSVTGDLSANLSAATNPATGVYRWTYTVEPADTLEQIRFDVSATLGASPFTLSAYTQTTDFVGSTWTTDDRAKLVAVFDKLPSKAFLVGTANSDGDVEASDMTGNYPGSVGSVAGSVGSLGAQAKLDVNAEADTALSDAGVTPTVMGRLDVAVSTRLATASYTAPPSAATNATAVRTELAVELARIDVAVSTRLATAGYTAPLDAAATRAAIGLSAANLDAQIAALAAFVDTEIASIKSKTDNLPADTATVLSLLATAAELLKVRAATYDSADRDGDVITLSNGATQTISPTGRLTEEP